MKHWYLLAIAGILGIVILFSPMAESAIPPTRAWLRILTDTGNVTANSYAANLTMTGDGITITPFFANNTLRFTSGLTGLAVEDLTNVTASGCAVGQARVVNATGWYVCSNIGTGDVTGASNVGTGTGTVFRDEVLGTLNFKTLKEGSGITLTNNADDITINAASSGYTKINNLDGGDAKVLATNASNQATFKSLTAGTGITLQNNSKTVIISSSVTGGFTEMNSYPGGNAGILRSNSSGEAIFKSLTSGSGISLTNGTDSVTITCTGCGTGESTTGSNIGTSGTGVFSALVGFDLQFKKLISSTLSITSNSTNVILEAVGSSFTKINNLNGGDAKIIATNNSGQATFKTLTNGAGITITNGSKTLTIASTITQGYTKANNLDGGDAKLFATNSSNQVTAKTLTAGAGISITNGTKTLTITNTASGGGFTKINNVGTGALKLVQTNASNTANIKSITTTRGITLTNGTTTGQIDTNFKVNSITAQNKVWLTGFNNATTSGDFTTRTFALNNQTYVKGDIQIIGINNVTGVVRTNQFSVNTESCSAGQMIRSIDNVTGNVVCATVTASGGANSLASNVTLAGSPSQDVNIWTIPLTANSGNTIRGVINAFTSVSGTAPRGAANLTAPSNAEGYCMWIQVSTTSANAIDNLVLNTVLTGRATNTGETAWIAAANRPMPIIFDCTIKAGASPGNLKIWLTPELSGATIGAKAGSLYIKTP